MRQGLCILCRTTLPPFGKVTPTHCFGKADEPPPPGFFGGFRCSCSCRNRRPKEANDG